MGPAVDPLIDSAKITDSSSARQFTPLEETFLVQQVF